MSKARDSVRAQVRGGLLLTAGLLGSFAWLFFALYGIETLRGRLLHPALPVGLAVLAALLTVAWLTVQHWGKFFPGFLAYGAINAIGAVATGHSLGPNPTSVPRLDGWLMVVFLAGAVLATVGFARRGPTRAGGLAMTGYLACFLWLIADPRESAAAFGAGFALLATAWIYDRLSGEGGTRRRSRPRAGRTPAAQASSRGHVERANRTHTEEFHEITPSDWRLPALNRDLRLWERTYNTVRPHQALGYRTPLEFLQELQRGAPPSTEL